MNTNNKFKNSVFTMLFSDPDLLRELYCALEGVSLPHDVPVTINTLENALFMGRINDVSFEIDGRLVVKVININEGRNEAIAVRCKKLAEYSAFVAKARAFIKRLGSREEAVKEAVKYCEKHGILKEFLKHHAAEVLGMLFTEWNLEDALAVAREEALEDGFEKGHEEGMAEGLEEGRTDEKLEIARNILAKGMTPEFVRDITGLDLETIAGIDNCQAI
jgi:predicted transposase/invertase (TIGR01784 family)